jgi:ankyrin repeat protein
MRAAYSNHPSTVTLLAQLGADINACDSFGLTALLHASSNQYADTVLALLKSGADVDASDNMGYTALHHAAATGNKDIVRMLVEAKADIGRRDNTGRTPWLTALHINKDAGLRALLEPDPEMERYLRELQRDKHAADVAKHMLMIYR